MRPSPSSRALEAILRDLIDTRDGATYFAERVWGVSLRYDLGDEHPLVGRSCPDFELDDGTRLGALLRDGGGCAARLRRAGAAAGARRPLGGIGSGTSSGRQDRSAERRARASRRLRRMGK